MKIYLDNCCFNRPYDNQNSITIFLETEAKLFIQNENNPNSEKKELIKDWSNFSAIDIIENDNVIDKSTDLIKIGLNLYDSLHIACAIEGKAEYFVTTDSKILNKMNLIGEIKTINPIDFVKIYTGE